MARVPGLDWVNSRLAQKAALKHADAHAAGGSDVITPESIGAIGTDSGVYTGHPDDLTTPGTYFINGVMLPENGYPDQPNRWGTILVTAGNGRVMQLSTSNGGEVAHMRYKGTGGLWSPWQRVVFDNDPRLLDTGWRDITSLVNPTLDATSPGQMLIRREGSIATARFLSLRSATDTAPVVLMTVPLGFRAGTGRAVGLVPVQTSIDSNYRLTAYSTVLRLAGRWGATGMWANGWSSFDSLTGDLSWFVDEPPPVTLPGTPA